MKENVEKVWQAINPANGLNYDNKRVTHDQWKLFVHKVFNRLNDQKLNKAKNGAKHTVISLAQTTPEISKDFEIKKGILPPCKHGLAWKASNSLLGSSWSFIKKDELPKKKKSTTKSKSKLERK